MADLTFQQFSTVQSNQQPAPPTIASATTITPTTRLTFVTGTTACATVTAPTTGYAEIVLIFTNASPAAFTTAGNVFATYQPVQNIPMEMFYNPTTAKWYARVGA